MGETVIDHARTAVDARPSRRSRRRRFQRSGRREPAPHDQLGRSVPWYPRSAAPTRSRVVPAVWPWLIALVP